jgi:hypothetical protein
VQKLMHDELEQEKKRAEKRDAEEEVVIVELK